MKKKELPGWFRDGLMIIYGNLDVNDAGKYTDDLTIFKIKRKDDGKYYIGMEMVSQRDEEVERDFDVSPADKFLNEYYGDFFIIYDPESEKDLIKSERNFRNVGKRRIKLPFGEYLSNGFYNKSFHNCACTDLTKMPGKCVLCKGTGKKNLFSKCSYCDGTGICEYCSGKGKSEKEILCWYEVETGLLLESEVREYDKLLSSVRLIEINPKNILDSRTSDKGRSPRNSSEQAHS